jgi:hypothetical protein
VLVADSSCRAGRSRPNAKYMMMRLHLRALLKLILISVTVEPGGGARETQIGKTQRMLELFSVPSRINQNVEVAK